MAIVYGEVDLFVPRRFPMRKLVDQEVREALSRSKRKGSFFFGKPLEMFYRGLGWLHSQSQTPSRMGFQERGCYFEPMPGVKINPHIYFHRFYLAPLFLAIIAA